MKHTLALIALFTLNIAVSPANAAAMNMAETVTVGDISISGAWSRSSAGMKNAGAAFMTITNAGNADDRLVAATTPVAKKAELHTHLMENGVMKMRQVKAIDVPAGKTAELKPGGLHVMLFRLSDTFEEGAHYPLTLTFEKAGNLTVMVHIGKAGAMGEMKHEDHMDHDDMTAKCMEMQGDMKKDCLKKAAMPGN